LPLRDIWELLATGTSLRDVAHQHHTSPMAVQSVVLRLGRQAMAAQVHLLHHLEPRSNVCFDGLRSFVVAQDYPCDITAVVDRPGETILTMNHTVMRRGGQMTDVQRERYEQKNRIWRPERGAYTADITLITDEIWGYLRSDYDHPAIIDTDWHPIYYSALIRDRRANHFRSMNLFMHLRTPSSAARTMRNRLFPVNYVDRLLRHRQKEHMRETIAGGRHASLQMHRSWLFAWEHNARRPWRVRRPEAGCHAVHASRRLPAAVDDAIPRRLQRQFFSRRLRLLGCSVPISLRRVWLAQLPTPPVRWQVGQKGTTVRIPKYAKRDLAQGNP